MLKSYLKIAWRNLFRNRTLSFINLFGLSISIAFCLLLFLHIRYEQSFDTFHVNKDRLFRVEMGSLWENNEKKAYDDQHNVVFPLVVGPDLANTFPEVSSYIRFQDGEQELVRAGGTVYQEDQAVYADPTLLTRLSFTMVQGDAKTALASPGNVVLSESTAKKYFGDQDPMGKTIELVSDSNRLLKVVGVVRDAPANSSIRFSVIVPLMADPDYAENIKERFNHSSHYLLIELKPGADEAALEAKVNAWIKSYYIPAMSGSGAKPEQIARFRWYLRPFADCHYNASGHWGHYTDAKALYELASIVVVILLLASLNYVLITVSNAAARTQEIGVRKVMGAGRLSIIFQSWLETQLMVGIAMIIGLCLAEGCLPLLRSVIGSGISYASISWNEVIVLCLGLALLLGVLAGYYPALLISRLKPADTIKSFSTFRVQPRFSRVLVVVQFTCCVSLMMAAFVIGKQMHYVLNKDLGFDKEQVLLVHNPSYDGEFSRKVKDELFVFARSQPSILQYSSMGGGDLMGGNNTNGYWINGERRWMKMIYADYNYFELLGIKVLRGRTFLPAYPTDSLKSVRACVVNETMWKLLGPRAQLGVYDTSIRQTIVGVVNDYNFESLSKKIEPELHRMVRGYAGNFLFRVRAGQMPATIAALEAEWKRVTNNYPFEYSFLDESIARMYAADMQWQKAMTAACFFAILIACMGLFGLAAINVVNRTREIGIRKVLGAGVRDLLELLSMGFLRLVFVSILLAAPLSWWIANRWLADFAYRITIQWWMFVVVGLAALAIALATVSLQVWRAARANPVEALRNE